MIALFDYAIGKPKVSKHDFFSCLKSGNSYIVSIQAPALIEYLSWWQLNVIKFI